QLEDPQVWDADEAHPSVARIENHLPMAEQHLRHPSLPHPALCPQSTEGRGHLRPAHWVRRGDDPVRLAQLAEVAMELEDHLHIVRDEAVLPPSGLYGRVPPEQAEGAGDDQEAAKAAPRGSSDEE